MAPTRSLAARNRLENPWLQRAALCAVLLAVFWHGLFAGVPRADQLAYLHQAGQYGGLWDILRQAPAWNRVQGAGDFALYRPVLYALLGMEHHFFRYDFFLWQATSLILHTATVLGVHALLMRGALRQTPLPFLLALFFGTSLLGSEMVLWNHMAGYLLFCALAVFSLVLLLRHLDTGGLPALAGCLALALLAEFTYELGVALCGLLALGFALRHVLAKAATTPSPRGGSDLFAALMFLLAALAYPAISLADLHLRGIARPFTGEEHGVLATLPLALDYAAQQARFWLGGWLFPSAYVIQANSRALFLGTNAAGPLFLVNALASLVFLAVLLVRLRAVRAFLSQGRQTRLLALLGVLLFACAYSLVIAQGRAVPRGLEYVLRINIYYSYIFCLALVAGAGLVLALPGSGPARPDAAARRAVVALSLCLAVMTGCNALSTAALARSYRHDYAAPRQALADAVEKWLAGPGRAPDAYFSISPECTGNDPQPWMSAAHLRKGSGWQPPVTFADALWPEKSYALNRARLSGSQIRLTELPYGGTKTLVPGEPSSAP